jgi:hypothetical protein
MIRYLGLAILVVLGVAAVVPAQTAPRKPMPADFDVLNRKSIFSRDRSRRTARVTVERTLPTTAPLRERALPVFVGVVQDDAGCMAFVEDPETGLLMELRPGESIPGQRVTVRAVTLDTLTIEYSPSRPPRVLNLGEDLRGTMVSLIPTTIVEPLPSATAPAVPVAPTNPAALDAAALAAGVPADRGAAPEELQP